jgi:hypothetical protein
MKKHNLCKNKSKDTVNNVLAPHSVVMAVQNLNEMSFLGFFTDGSNHTSLKLLPVVINYFHKVHGIKPELTEI